MRIFLSVLVLCVCISLQAKPPAREFYQIKIYHLTSADQEKMVDEYLKNAYLPALKRAGIQKVGVFKPIESDTALYGKRIFLLIPFKSLDQFAALGDVLQKDAQYLAAGKNYIDAPYTNPPFERIESILSRAFPDMPQLEIPALTSPAGERIYELRSYEGHTEKIYKNKEHMFNEGGEIKLFRKLGFNAVFYSEVLAGNTFPNLMYMTTFENKASRDEHWKMFGNSPEWKKMSGLPEYQNNVSKITVYLLHPTGYSAI
ncbi:MAG TPA: NIPSNAP family protein [Ohtaekwangia sp.]|nr:NIPSNAP family protein [Ohtaekwangia sp.]